jgi:hypothetical protein
MRKQILIPCAIVLAICLAFLLFRATQHQKTTSSEQIESPTNQTQSQPQQSKAVEKIEVSTAPNPGKIPPRPTQTEISNLQEQVLASWQRPIEFYGKVVDENTNPVAEANITFKWAETPSKEGNRTANTESDSEGLFSLRGQHGPSLAIWVSKKGYYASHRGQEAVSYLHGDFSPDPQNPVIFLLHKKGQGAELITSENGMRSDVWVPVPKDNTPVRVDFFQKKASATGQLEVSQNKPPWQGATNWSFSLSIQDGGLVENQDEFQFQAPDAGYQPTIEYNFAKAEPDWTTHVTKQFYIMFGQPRKYGWLRFESDISQETVFLTYVINPTGSQNLEPQ